MYIVRKQKTGELGEQSCGSYNLLANTPEVSGSYDFGTMPAGYALSSDLAGIILPVKTKDATAVLGLSSGVSCYSCNNNSGCGKGICKWEITNNCLDKSNFHLDMKKMIFSQNHQKSLIKRKWLLNPNHQKRT